MAGALVGMGRSIRIERAQKGYIVHADDPKIVEANNKRSTSKEPCTPWNDPEREYVFKTKKEMAAFVEKIIDVASPIPASPPDTFAAAFDAAVAADGDD